jgi:hypothetical protein
MARHKRAERAVITFAVAIVIAGVAELSRHEQTGWDGVVLGIAMLAVTEWIVWRR